MINSLQTGEHTDWALASVVIKTVVLYAIMVTGAIWEKVVFGQYCSPPLSIGKTWSAWGSWCCTPPMFGLGGKALWSANDLLWLALAAYGSYAINAAQYIRKLRMARLQKQPSTSSMPDTGAQARHMSTVIPIRAETSAQTAGCTDVVPLSNAASARCFVA